MDRRTYSCISFSWFSSDSGSGSASLSGCRCSDSRVYPTRTTRFRTASGSRSSCGSTTSPDPILGRFPDTHLSRPGRPPAGSVPTGGPPNIRIIDGSSRRRRVLIQRLKKKGRFRMNGGRSNAPGSRSFLKSSPLSIQFFDSLSLLGKGFLEIHPFGTN